MSATTSKPKINYWIFQVNPTLFNLRNALRNEALHTFSVRSHKKRIQQGDRIIFWQSGQASGCYALGRVTSNVEVLPFDRAELPYILKTDILNKERSAVRVEIEYNLWNYPIFKEELATKWVTQMKINLPGTNFEATSEQYNALLHIIEMRNEISELHEPKLAYLRTATQHPLNQILYGAPGTGKTYQAISRAIAILEAKTLAQINELPRTRIMERFREYVAQQQLAMVTFHPSFTYEDFVEGIKPVTTDAGEVSYTVVDGIFKRMALSAIKQKNSNTTKNNRHVLIIDEINRANLSNVLGELITLLEPEKRAGQLESVNVQLPYSKSPFGVPNNLYIIGTMNTSDRSATLLDFALRRRFQFQECLPNYDLLQTVGQVDVSQILQTINLRIAHLLDENHVIGHTYFLNIKRLEDLQQVFAHNILPLLQAYFYNDLSKLGQILGKAFIKQRTDAPEAAIFSSFDDGFNVQISATANYYISARHTWNESAFRSIYQY